MSRYDYEDERGMYFDMQGKPMKMMEWAAAFENVGERKIGSFDNQFVHVSTVWLGLDHAFFGGPPLIFETMVFPKPPFESGDSDMDRYSTLAQAKGGHLDMVEKWTGLRGFWCLFWMTVWERATRE